MTHRFDLQTDDRHTRVLFQGLLDRAALSELIALCRTRTRRGTSVRVLLGAGTTVEAGLVDELARVEGIVLEAESAFLSRWIQSCQSGGPTER